MGLNTPQSHWTQTRLEDSRIQSRIIPVVRVSLFRQSDEEEEKVLGNRGVASEKKLGQWEDEVEEAWLGPGPRGSYSESLCSCAQRCLAEGESGLKFHLNFTP